MRGRLWSSALLDIICVSLNGACLHAQIAHRLMRAGGGRPRCEAAIQEGGQASSFLAARGALGHATLSGPPVTMRGLSAPPAHLKVASVASIVSSCHCASYISGACYYVAVVAEGGEL